jgi:hypothetical protein
MSSATLPHGFPAVREPHTGPRTSDQLMALERIALMQAGALAVPQAPPVTPRRRLAVLVLLIATAALILSAPPGPAGAQDVNRYGAPICDRNGWTWIQAVPRMMAHDSAGSCIEVPSKTRAAMIVTTAPENGSYPNISSGYALGLSGCPSAYDVRHGLCLKYPDRVAGNRDPVASVKAWDAPGYQGNLAFDMWFSAKPGNTSFQGRCSTVLSKADTEIMVWLAHPGDIAVPDTGHQYQTWIGGRRWKIDTWETFNHCPAGEGWRLVLIMAPRLTNGQVTVHDLKLNLFWKYAIKNGWLRDDEWNTAIDLGWEMDHGGTGNAIEGYSLRAGR